MCTLQDIPTSYYLPLPWREPLYWLAFIAMLGLAIGGMSMGFYVQRRLHNEFAHVQRIAWLGRLWAILLVLAGLTFTIGSVITVLLWVPAIIRKGTWFESEVARLQAHGCDLHTLFATDTQLNSAMSPLAIASASCLVILVLLFVLILICGGSLIAAVRSHHLHVEPSTLR